MRCTRWSVQVLPGVPALLERLVQYRDVALGLLTGNVAGGARLKLGSAGLFHHFRTGAYGSDSEERNELPGVALNRAYETWGVRFEPQEVLVIGDTPRDVECGLAHDVRYPVAALREAGAHHVVQDFSTLDEVAELLVG